MSLWLHVPALRVCFSLVDFLPVVKREMLLSPLNYAFVGIFVYADDSPSPLSARRGEFKSDSNFFPPSLSLRRAWELRWSIKKEEGFCLFNEPGPVFNPSFVSNFAIT